MSMSTEQCSNQPFGPNLLSGGMRHLESNTEEIVPPRERSGRPRPLLGGYRNKAKAFEGATGAHRPRLTIEDLISKGATNTAVMDSVSSVFTDLITEASVQDAGTTVHAFHAECNGDFAKALCQDDGGDSETASQLSCGPPLPAPAEVLDDESDVWSVDGDDDDEDVEDQLALAYASCAVQAGLEVEASMPDSDEEVLIEQEADSAVVVELEISAPETLVAMPPSAEVPARIERPFLQRPSVGTWFHHKPWARQEPEVQEARTAAVADVLASAALPVPVQSSINLGSDSMAVVPEVVLEAADATLQDTVQKADRPERRAAAPVLGASRVSSARKAHRLEIQTPEELLLQEELANEIRERERLAREEEDALRLVDEFLMEQAPPRQAAADRGEACQVPKAPTSPRAPTSPKAPARKAEAGEAPARRPRRARPVAVESLLAVEEPPAEARLSPSAARHELQSLEPVVEPKLSPTSMARHSRHRTIIGAVRDSTENVRRLQTPLPEPARASTPAKPQTAASPPGTGRRRPSVHCAGSPAGTMGTVRHARQLASSGAQKECISAFRIDSDVEDSSRSGNGASNRAHSVVNVYEALGVELHTMDDSPTTPKCGAFAFDQPRIGTPVKQSLRPTTGKSRFSALSHAASTMVADGIPSPPPPSRSLRPPTSSPSHKKAAPLSGHRGILHLSAMAMDLSSDGVRLGGSSHVGPTREDLARASSLGPLAPYKLKQSAALPSVSSKSSLADWNLGGKAGAWQTQGCFTQLKTGGHAF